MLTVVDKMKKHQNHSFHLTKLNHDFCHCKTVNLINEICTSKLEKKMYILLISPNRFDLKSGVDFPLPPPLHPCDSVFKKTKKQLRSSYLSRSSENVEMWIFSVRD